MGANASGQHAANEDNYFEASDELHACMEIWGTAQGSLTLAKLTPYLLFQ